MNTKDSALQLTEKAQQSIDQRSWSMALSLAGLAVIRQPYLQASFVQLARLCFLLGDDAMGDIYLQLAKSCPLPNDSALKEAYLSQAKLDSLAVEWQLAHKAGSAHVPNKPLKLPSTGLRIIAGGDVMLGRQMPGWVGLRGADSPFANLATVIKSADLAMANLETCVSTLGDFLNKGGRQPYYYHCLPEMLDVLIAAGISCVSTGNNHAMDFGAEALKQQTQILESSGFLHFGAGHDKTDAAMPKYADVKGITVAFIGVETETPTMAASHHLAGVNYASVHDLVRSVCGSIAIARAHADVVIVSPHWGINWEQSPTADIRDCARRLIDLGADAVLGHSAHILQGIEFHGGRPIIYDMGTLLFDRVVQNTMRDSALFDLTWDAQRNCELTIRPVKLRTARAKWAEGEDFQRICALTKRLCEALDPNATLQIDSVGMHMQGKPGPSTVRQITKQPLSRVFDPHQSPKVNDALRLLRSHLVYNTLPDIPGIWSSPLTINPKLSILGARYASPARPGRGFVCEVYFRAEPPDASQRLEARIAGLTADGEEAFSYIHPVAEGIHPPARWQFKDIICDRISVRPVKSVPAGIYKLCWSLVDLQSGETMSVDLDDKRIINGQVMIGELVVSETAPNSVAGIAAPPLLPRAETPLKTFGGWQGQIDDFWTLDALPWVTQKLHDKGLIPLSLKPDVVRDAPSVLVVRVATPNGNYYFKALEARNHFEPALVSHLAIKWSGRIACPLAVDASRGWMLTPDYGVELLGTRDKNIRLTAFEGVAVNLAEIQIDTCTQVDKLLALGVPDRRPHLLADLFEQLLNDDRAINLGLSTGVQVAERDLALRLMPTMRSVCEKLSNESFSNGLDHGDLHLRNILELDNRFVLFDWDTACITHPFCSLLLPFDDKGINDTTDFPNIAGLVGAYLAPWVKHLGKPSDELTPILHQAVWVAHAVRALLWSKAPNGAKGSNTDKRKAMVAKWVRLWNKRASILSGQGSTSTAPVPIAPSPHRPPKLATPDNPLLLDRELIARVTEGTWHNLEDASFISGVSFHRAYLAGGTSGNLFFALNSDVKNEKFDADNIESVRRALKLGAVAAVVPKSAQNLPAEFPVLKVDHVLKALYRLGEFVRDKLFLGKRILVSGTEGKTGFKTMLHHVLSPQISTHAVTNSANLGFAVQASLASIRKNDQIEIIEAAGTHPGRLATRSDGAKPHLFVLTEVGNEHINYHGSQQGVIESKADIVMGLVEGGYGLLNADSRNYEAVRKAILTRRRVPILLFGSGQGCNGRLLDKHFENNAWTVKADIEGTIVKYQVPLLGDHVPLATVSVLLAAFYLGADVAQAAADFANYQPFESQGVLRRIAHRDGEICCYDNSSRASVLSYQSTLRMATLLTPPTKSGKKVAMIGQMIFLGKESEIWHAKIAEWIEAAGFDKVILVGAYTEITFAHLKRPEVVVQRFPDYDRRQASKKQLQTLIDAINQHCDPGDLLFIKGEVDEVGEHLRTREIPPGAPTREAITKKKPVGLPSLQDPSALTGLRPLELSDLPHFRTAINQTTRMVWQHYFPFIYLLGKSGGHQFLLEEDSGSLCVYLLRQQKDHESLSVFLLPMPMQMPVLDRCIERVKAYNHGDRASLFRVDPDEIALLRGRANSRVVTCPQEYIYAPPNYIDLAGKKNKNLRHAVNMNVKRGDLEVLDYQTSYVDECIQVLVKWASLQREKYGGVFYSGFTQNCLKLYDQFPRNDLSGMVIRIDGKICSFGFFGEMRKGVGNLFIGYSDLSIPGLNRFSIYTRLRMMEHLEFANASHAGDTPGLAVAKQTMGPAFMLQPYQVYAG